MDVSLVIPTLNAGRQLSDVLEAIDRQAGAASLERLAVDSGSSDGTVPLLKRHGFRVIGVERSRFDHGATRDFAISQTRGEVVVLLTQDSLPADTHWLPALVACYDDPRVAAAYSRQIPRPDCNPIIARRLEDWAGGSRRVVQEVPDRAAFEALAPLERLARCTYDNVSGSVRRTVWEKHPFRTHRFGEDLAFGKRVILDGWRIVFEPRSTVVHSHDRSVWAEARRIYFDHQNRAELFDARLIGSLQELGRQVRGARHTYLRILADAPLSPGRRHALLRWARRYALASNVAIYLGARSSRLRSGALRPALRALDRRLFRGI